MATFPYSALGTKTLAIAGGATAPTLKNLADGARVLGDEINTRNQIGEWLLRVRLVSAPTAGELVRVWFILDVGNPGTEEYEDGSATVEPIRIPDLFFPVRDVTTQQIIAATSTPIRKPNSPFKCLLKNDTGVAFTNTDDENELFYSFFDTESV